jgi:hypothetical protein
MSNSYIKIKCTKSGGQKTPENIGQIISNPIMTTDIPIANPDFESKIDKVSSWLIEFEADSYYPSREIGLNNLDKPIMIMPWKKNYGYWTDNNLVIEDFRLHFYTIDISKKEFEKNWNLFEKEN